VTVERHVELAVLSGLSGAGRSEAAKALEDLGWYVIDNLPPQLVGQMVALALNPSSLISRIALVMDARGGASFEEAEAALDALGESVDFRLVFLEADDAELVRRFDATRRRHPLTADENVIAGIREERRLMRSFRDRADLVIDTTNLTARDLRFKINALFGGAEQGTGLTTTVVSFGYKYGVPLDADMVLDVRFLPNPHWVEELRPFSGLDEEVRGYVLGQSPTAEFLERTKALFEILMPGFITEGRHYLTIAIGCTGGRHRSVVLGDEIAKFIQELGYGCNVIHRDVEREPLTR
jgi:UPF0042 nucleotide-binding protein